MGVHYGLLAYCVSYSVRQAYLDNTEAFTTLFEDEDKHRAMMEMIGKLLVEKFR
ncbi:hypothetical protein [Enorma phocaeensis]|uniref:hypothetical protein n=1 Tax=Enorma phocaeensis TaxID=1871019 RepID=UPI00195B3791|nr:hypothetical protein [Enorma phocaeensis]MBM6953778.1 hypothetical protein [Enorma phocaeensis]